MGPSGDPRQEKKLPAGNNCNNVPRHRQDGWCGLKVAFTFQRAVRTALSCPAPVRLIMDHPAKNADALLIDSTVVCENSHGVEIRGRLARLGRHQVAFEADCPASALQVSEVLSSLQINRQGRTLYRGRAVVTALMDQGLGLLCEASLGEEWLEAARMDSTSLRADFAEFMRQWRRFQRIQPEFKSTVADMRAFLGDLRLWLEQAELDLVERPGGQEAGERELAQRVTELAFPAVEALFERFEHLASAIPADECAAHQWFLQREFQPLVLASPFAERVIRKPLGYAGDYEMVNMILRDPHEGSSLYGRVLNRWFIGQPPAEAHRNRAAYLTQRLADETFRTMRQNRPLRVFNVGCGPAGEVQNYLAQCEAASHAQFTLLDFNEETIQYTRRVLQASLRQHRRTTDIEFVKKSVVQLLKARPKEGEPAPQYDFVYCAGLYDYLPNSICRQLLDIFHDWVAPGGLVIVTNVDAQNPIRHWLEYVLEWHLIYRNAAQMLALRPRLASQEDVRIQSDVTGVNLFLEIRKPMA